MSNPDPSAHGSETCLVIAVFVAVLAVLGAVGLILDAY